jgi:hypothetical protein
MAIKKCVKYDETRSVVYTHDIILRLIELAKEGSEKDK